VNRALRRLWAYWTLLDCAFVTLKCIGIERCSETVKEGVGGRALVINMFGALRTGRWLLVRARVGHERSVQRACANTWRKVSETGREGW